MHAKKIDEALQAAFPELIVGVITQVDDKANIAPINFQAISTKYERPLTVCLGISNTSHSLASIRSTKQFVVALPDAKQMKDIIYCGTVSGKNVDKLAHTDLEFADATSVDPPLLIGAILNLECTHAHSYVAGDFTIVIGTIVELHHNQATGLQKIYALGGAKYGTLRIDQVLQEGR